MSDHAQGYGWWQAADYKWYPPESHPEYRPIAAPPPPLSSMQPPQGQPVYLPPPESSSGGTVGKTVAIVIAVVVLVAGGLGVAALVATNAVGNSTTNANLPACRAEMNTLAVAFGAAKVTNDSYPSAGETAADYLTDPSALRYFALPTAAGADRIATEKVSEEDCPSVAAP